MVVVPGNLLSSVKSNEVRGGRGYVNGMRYLFYFIFFLSCFIIIIIIIIFVMYEVAMLNQLLGIQCNCSLSVNNFELRICVK